MLGTRSIQERERGPPASVRIRAGDLQHACRHRAALALGDHLWEARLPEEVRRGATPGTTPRPAAARWLALFQTNLLDNPCFLLSQQEMENPHVRSPALRIADSANMQVDQAASRSRLRQVAGRIVLNLRSCRSPVMIQLEQFMIGWSPVANITLWFCTRPNCIDELDRTVLNWPEVPWIATLITS